jgi:hypothetical protein
MTGTNRGVERQHVRRELIASAVYALDDFSRTKHVMHNHSR